MTFKIKDLKCQNGHKIINFCMVKTCDYHAEICKICDTKLHNGCLTISPENILKLMKNKSLVYQKYSAKILQTYNIIQEMVQKEKQSFINLIQNKIIKLNKDEEELYSLLSKKPLKNIKPILINNVIQTLQIIPSKQENQKLLQDFLIKAEKTLKELKPQFIDLRKSWDSTQIDTKIINLKEEELCKNRLREVTNFCFLNNLNHQDYYIQQDNNQITKSSRQSYKFSLVFPSVEIDTCGVTRLTLQILQGSDYCFIGMAHYNQLKRYEFSWYQQQNGIYIVDGGNGQVKNLQNPKQNGRRCNFRFWQQDKIQIDYDHKHQLFKISNLSQKMDYTMRDVKKIKGNPLYFCVVLGRSNNSVRILKSEKIQ